MLLLVAVGRCIAALREGGYRRRQCEAGKTSAKEHTHRDCRRFPHASPPQRPAKRRSTVLGCEAAQHPCERTECMMDARLGGLVRIIGWPGREVRVGCLISRGTDSSQTRRWR